MQLITYILKKLHRFFLYFRMWMSGFPEKRMYERDVPFCNSTHICAGVIIEDIGLLCVCSIHLDTVHFFHGLSKNTRRYETFLKDHLFFHEKATFG